jgi:hypothetical protein
MKTGSYRTLPPDPEAWTIRTPSAWPLTFTARAHFGAPRPLRPWLAR